MPSNSAGWGPRQAGPGNPERWENEWQQELVRPASELSTQVPAELEVAAKRHWLPRGGRVLDIGCGRGQIAAWLARRGHPVVGVDLAPSAIALARRHFGSLPGIEFSLGDICSPQDGLGQFDALVDRNCFHLLGRQQHDRYVASVARLARPGAAFFLFVGLPLGESPERVIAHFDLIFGEHFRRLGAGRTMEPLARSAGPLPRWRLPGLAFYLKRLPAAA